MGDGDNCEHRDSMTEARRAVQEEAVTRNSVRDRTTFVQAVAAGLIWRSSRVVSVPCLVPAS
jgi:hypothetical protein